MIQLTHSSSVISGSRKDLERLQAEFEEQHCIVLPALLDPGLLQLIQRQVDQAVFYKRIHEKGGNPPPVDFCMNSNEMAVTILHLLVNEPGFFQFIQQVTGCGRIGCFAGSVYRLVPDQSSYDSWHDDIVSHRMVAMSLNLSREVYVGGVLQIRDWRSGEMVHEVANTGFGDAVIFRISPDLKHRVSSLEGTSARTAFAGWFLSQPDFRSVIKKDSPTLS